MTPIITSNQIIQAFEGAAATPLTWVNGIISAERAEGARRVRVAVAWQQSGENAGWSIYYQVERLDEQWGWITIVDESAGLVDVADIELALNLI